MSQGFAAPPPPSGSPARTRPATVTAATWLLLLVAALAVVSVGMAVATAGTVADVYREAYRGTELEGTEGVATAGTLGGAGFMVLLGIGLAVLAVLDYRGKNPARIVTWVIGGLTLCCSGAGLALSGVTSNMQFDAGEGPDPAEVQRMVEDALPGWYGPVSITVTVLTILALAVALLLLALPPSNEFFRKPERPFEPPVPGYPPPPGPPPVG
jgi:hypothetical protein